MLFTFCTSLLAHASAQRATLMPRYGFVLPHSSDMTHYIDSHVPGIGAALMWRTDGSKNWHHYFNFPYWGLTLQHDRLPTDTLGNSTSLLLTNVLPLDENRRLELGLGIGANYVSKPFDLESNPKNNAIGSHFNVALQIYLGWKLPVSNRLFVEPQISISHASNGAFKSPNKGINIISASLNLGLRLDTTSLPARNKPPVNKGQTKWMVGFLGGAMQFDTPGSEQYPVVTLLVQRLTRVSGKSSLGGAVDFEYNAGHFDKLIEKDNPAPNRLSTVQAGISGVWMLHFGKLQLATALGVYAYNLYEGDGRIFNRYTLFYNLGGHFTLNAGLKAHFANADHMEIGMHYKW